MDSQTSNIRTRYTNHTTPWTLVDFSLVLLLAVLFVALLRDADSSAPLPARQTADLAGVMPFGYPPQHRLLREVRN